MKREIKSILQDAAIALVACIGLALVIFGSHIFEPRNLLFALVPFGIIGSITLSLSSRRLYRDAAYAAAVMLILSFIIIGPGATFTIYLIYFSAVVSGVFLFAHYFYTKLAARILARPLVLAAMMAFAFSIATVIQWTIFADSETPLKRSSNLPIGFLIGLALGTGLEVSHVLTQLMVTRQDSGRKPSVQNGRRHRERSV